MPDLSVLIPSCNEMFVRRTVDDVLAHARGDTEVIVVLDGQWADPPLEDDPRLRVIHVPTALGQRGAVNLAAQLSQARYVMKLDAHCSVAEGFDVTLMAAGEDLGRDVTQIPAMANLHVFNWRCKNCGREVYQGPRPATCVRDAKRDRELAESPQPCGASVGFDRVMVWEPRRRRSKGNGSPGLGGRVRTEFWRFDHELHFQYWNGHRDAHGCRVRGYGHRPEAQGEICDVMSSVGACWFIERRRFWELGGLDDAGHGSWGQMGTEIACKSWLSGGRQVVNKRTWFAHLFRTNQAFTFPYPMSGQQQQRARARSRQLWIEGTWPQAVHPLRWLVEKFAPVPDWTEECIRALPVPAVARVGAARQSALTAGLVYYSDCRGDATMLAAVRKQIQRCANESPIVSVTLQPIAFGTNIVLPLERGQLTMFRQILAGLEALETDVAFLVEHDVLYHPSHFAFTPDKAEVFYYNQHTWKVSTDDGRALFYRCCQTSGLCARRDLLVDHYRKRVAFVEQHGWDRNVGYEPGTNRRVRRLLDPRGCETWMSDGPNIDLRHGHNLTRSRWRQDQFRNKRSCLGWTEADAVPGWGRTKGRFDAFLAEIGQRP